MNGTVQAQTVDEPIPDAVLVPCPLVGFKQRRAMKCAECPHFKGVMAVNANPQWPDGFRIYCAHPVTRRVAMIEDD